MEENNKDNIAEDTNEEVKDTVVEETSDTNIEDENKEETGETVVDKETTKTKEVSVAKPKNKGIYIICGVIIVIMLGVLVVLKSNTPDIEDIHTNDPDIVNDNTESNTENNKDNTENKTESNEQNNKADEADKVDRDVLNKNTEPYIVKDADGNEYEVKYKFNEKGQIVDYTGNIVEDPNNLLDDDGNIIQTNGILNKDNVYVKEDISKYNLDELEKDEEGNYILPDGRLLVYKSDEDYLITEPESDATDATDATTSSGNAGENKNIDPDAFSNVVFESKDLRVFFESFNRGLETEYKVRNKQNTGNIVFRVYPKNNKSNFTVNLLNLMVNGQGLDYSVYEESTSPDCAIAQSWFISPNNANTEEIYSVTCEILVNYEASDVMYTTNTIDVTNMITKDN